MIPQGPWRVQTRGQHTHETSAHSTPREHRATPLMTPTTDLSLSIRVSMFEYARLVTGTSSGRAASSAAARHSQLARVHTDGWIRGSFAVDIPVFIFRLKRRKTPQKIPFPARKIGLSPYRPLEQARVENGADDEWVLTRMEFLGFARIAYHGNPRILGIPTIRFQ